VHGGRREKKIKEKVWVWNRGENGAEKRSGKGR